MPKQLQQPGGWHRADIMAAVYKKDMTLRSLALANGLGESTCRAALMKPSPTANRAIAKLIGIPVHKLWPQWFDKYGNRLISNCNSSRTKRRRTSQKRIGCADMGTAA